MTTLNDAPFETLITALNKQGEGMGVYEDKAITIPGALPGETVSALPRFKKGGILWGKLASIIAESPDRVPAPCPHNATCGGCSLQHLSPTAYMGFKTGLVHNALRRVGISKTIDAFIESGPQTRRRVDFWAKNWNDEIVIGFHGVGTQHLSNMTTCHVMTPALESLLGPLRQLMEILLCAHKEAFHIHILEATNGLDMLVSGNKRPLTTAETKCFVEFAQTHLCRLQLKIGKKPQTLFKKEQPYISLGGYAVAASPNSFLQATHDADKILPQLVLEGLPQASDRLKIADLYCGRGTLTLPLVRAGHKVMGFEGDSRGLQALTDACPEANCMYRDLFQDSITAAELRKYDVIVLNPPRTGATNQINQIAESGVDRIIYVSCGPESFAKEARILIDSGYLLTTLTAVDQFHWAAHVEVVGVFLKK